MTVSFLFYSAMIFLAILFFHYLLGTSRPLRCALVSGGLGIGALLAVDLTGLFTGVSLPLSVLNLLVSLSGGPSGVAMLLTINTWIV